LSRRRIITTGQRNRARFHGRLRRVRQLHPVFRRRLSHDLLEHAVEMRKRLKPDGVGNFADAQIGIEQQFLASRANRETNSVKFAGEVASAVHTSTFYFCKLFKRSTGVNFTEFCLADSRRESQEPAVNPNLRISEIAYAVGFQSLRISRRVQEDHGTIADGIPDANCRTRRKRPMEPCPISLAVL